MSNLVTLIAEIKRLSTAVNDAITAATANRNKLTAANSIMRNTYNLNGTLPNILSTGATPGDAPPDSKLSA
jgi:hypothetical protein